MRKRQYHHGLVACGVCDSHLSAGTVTAYAQEEI